MPDTQDDYTDECLAEFLHRSYAAVDGLWFMKVEESAGFDHALELDRQVWAVMPKIQARKTRELLDVDGNSPADLARCLGLKFAADSQDAEITHDEHCVRVVLKACMWFEMMQRSGRESYAGRIGEVICDTEFGVWAAEFGGSYEVSIPHRLCAGDGQCEILFRIAADPGASTPPDTREDGGDADQ